MTIKILKGDCRDVLRSLDAESVQTVITSPPYWGLRDYGVPASVWGGGDLECDHEWGDAVLCDRSEAARERSGGAANGHGLFQRERGCWCANCGAWRGTFGLEPTYQLYVEHAVEVFREVRRVLRPDGTLWLNLGDCYATGAGKVGEHPGGGAQGSAWSGRPALGMTSQFADRKVAALDGNRGVRTVENSGKHGPRIEAMGPMTQPNRMPQVGLKPKDLVGIPWRVAFALQDDGWWLRQEIIWHKPNPMPESVTDRCTKSHESLFLFAKNGGRSLLWHHRDSRAWVGCQPPADYVWRHRKTGVETREPQTGEGWSRINLWAGFDYYFDAEAIAERAEGLTEHDVTGPGYSAPGQTPHTGTRRSGYKERKPASARGVPIDTGGSTNGAVAGSVPWEGTTRNKRSVWTVGTAPFPDAHFATFPPALIEPAILAGSARDAVVLDPFGGAGTTGLVADRLGRNAVLIELNPEYADMAKRRIEGDAGMFASVASA